MNPINKLTILQATWLYLDSENSLSEENKNRYEYYSEFCIDEQKAEYIFYKMLESYLDNKHVKDMIKILEIDKVFEIKNLNGSGRCIVKYDKESLDYRLDLKNHSPMGFGNGGSSFKQMTLAILAKASNDKEALRYYEDFLDEIKMLMHKSILSDTYKINQIDILHSLSKIIFLNPVKRICKILGLKQKELAHQLNVSDVTVNRWSSKSVDVPLAMLRTFDLLEENSILRERVYKAEDILLALNKYK